MALTDTAKAALSKPLDRANVREREQGGRQLSYIESWHAIAEANRIFGFDGWDSETVEIKCVSERERPVGKSNPKPGWGVTYTAKVRVSVSGVVREGVGAGHGIDADLGLAHESAIKEAESDARKRALMTFGNPFGLALYDKAQANVADAGAEQLRQTVRAAYEAQIDAAPHKTALQDIWGDIQKEPESRLPQDALEALAARINDRLEEMKGKAA